MKPAMPTIIRGDARALPLPDSSVDLVVTSPPYFGLRSYTDGGEHYEKQIGSEATPAEFLAALLDVTAECARVLKPSGSMWINLGDKYSSGNSGESGLAKLGEQYRGGGHSDGKAKRRSSRIQGVPPKSLLLIPERYRIACTDQLGLICRAVLIWAKPNGLPESVTDRVRRSHEDWVHLTKQPRYYSAVDEIREATQGRPDQMTWEQRKARGDALRQGEQRGNFGRGMAGNALGKLPGSVWEIATQPLNVPAELGVDHFAAFPMEWPRRLILGWSPREVCSACGEGRRPVVARTLVVDHVQHRRRPGRIDLSEPLGNDRGVNAAVYTKGSTSATITGYVCACPETSAPATPGVVLDPFGGTGTTALVATMLGRRGIGVDLSADYCRLAEWRATDPKERARAAGLDPDAVARVAPRNPEQGDLFAAPQPDLLDDEAAS